MIATLVLTLMTAFAAGATPCAANERAPTTQPVEQAAASEPAGPRWVLSPSVYPDGTDDEAAYLRHLRAQRGSYDTAAAAAAFPEQLVQYELAAANLILARATEPFVSRWLLGLGDPEDEPALRAALAEARERLDQVTEWLEGGAEVGSEQQGAYRSDLETLRSFSTALNAVWSADDGPEALKARRLGAVHLAVLLEHERKDVASAALLWQAVLYQQMDRSDRAFRLLPLATKPIDPEAQTFQLLARLLRCRLVANRGGYAVACSLLLQLEERIHEWLERDPARDDAIHAAMLVRRQILEHWRDSLDPQAKADEIDWCANAIERLGTTATAEGREVRVLRLGQTVPLIAPLPETTPATAPAEADAMHE